MTRAWPIALLAAACAAAVEHRAPQPIARPAAVAPVASGSDAPSPLVEATPIADDAQSTPHIAVRWIVHPENAPDPHMEIGSRRVEVEVQAGGSLRRIQLGEQSGILHAHNLSACGGDTYSEGEHDVATLVFYYGGAGGFTLRREPADTLTVIAWSAPDGACIDARGQLDACPRTHKTLEVISVPSEDSIAEAIVELDGRGGQKRYECSGNP